MSKDNSNNPDDNTHFTLLPLKEQEKYLADIYKKPEARINKYISESMRLLNEDDLFGAERFAGKARATYDSEVLKNDELNEKLEKLAKELKEKTESLLKIRKETSDKAEKTLQ